MISYFFKAVSGPETRPSFNKLGLCIGDISSYSVGKTLVSQEFGEINTVSVVCSNSVTYNLSQIYLKNEDSPVPLTIELLHEIINSQATINNPFASFFNPHFRADDPPLVPDGFVLQGHDDTDLKRLFLTELLKNETEVPVAKQKKTRSKKKE